MIDPTTLQKGDTVLFGGIVAKVVGSLDWRSPSGKALISFGAVDGWHYEDDPLWAIAELVTPIIEVSIEARIKLLEDRVLILEKILFIK